MAWDMKSGHLRPRGRVRHHILSFGGGGGPQLGVAPASPAGGQELPGHWLARWLRRAGSATEGDCLLLRAVDGAVRPRQGGRRLENVLLLPGRPERGTALPGCSLCQHGRSLSSWASRAWGWTAGAGAGPRLCPRRRSATRSRRCARKWPRECRPCRWVQRPRAPWPHRCRGGGAGPGLGEPRGCRGPERPPERARRRPRAPRAFRAATVQLPGSVLPGSVLPGPRVHGLQEAGPCCPGPGAAVAASLSGDRGSSWRPIRLGLRQAFSWPTEGTVQPCLHCSQLNKRV